MLSLLLILGHRSSVSCPGLDRGSLSAAGGCGVLSKTMNRVGGVSRSRSTSSKEGFPRVIETPKFSRHSSLLEWWSIMELAWPSSSFDPRGFEDRCCSSKCFTRASLSSLSFTSLSRATVLLADAVVHHRVRKRDNGLCAQDSLPIR